MEKQAFIDKSIEALQHISTSSGYNKISIETLKSIMTGYVKKYQPPRHPGKLSSGMADKIRKEDHEMHRVPTMYHCIGCKRYKPQSDISTIFVREYEPKGICKACKSKNSNVVNLFK